MLTLLTFHRNEPCLSLGTATPAKNLLIHFPFTAGLRRLFSQDSELFSSLRQLVLVPLTLYRLGRAELSQAKTFSLRLEAKAGP